MSNFEIDPVAAVNGINYYFGTKENPFNFYPNINDRMLSLEHARLVQMGGEIIALKDKLPRANVRAYIEISNIALRQRQEEKSNWSPKSADNSVNFFQGGLAGEGF